MLIEELIGSPEPPVTGLEGVEQNRLLETYGPVVAVVDEALLRTHPDFARLVCAFVERKRTIYLWRRDSQPVPPDYALVRLEEPEATERGIKPGFFMGRMPTRH